MPRSLKNTLGPCYDEVAEQIEARLQPVDAMEVLLVAQIVRANWRLERCEQAQDPSHPDIDRVRKSAENSIRRNMAELRQLQADRRLNTELNLDLPGIARAKDILHGSLLSQKLAQSKQTSDRPTQAAAPAQVIAGVETKISALISKEQEVQSKNLKIRTQFATNIGRNAPCPCGSRLKYKRCCLPGAPPVASGNAPPAPSVPGPEDVPR